MESESNIVIEFPRFSGPFTDDQVTRAIESTLGIDDVTTIGALKFSNVWAVGFSDPTNAIKLRKLGSILVGDQTGFVQSTNPLDIQGRISWIPFYAGDQGIRNFLESFGTLHNLRLESKLIAGKIRKTNSRAFSMTLNPKFKADDIPHSFISEAGGYPGLIWIRGRRPKCLRCGLLGHIRKFCKEKKCLLCKTHYHLEENCPKKDSANVPLKGLINEAPEKDNGISQQSKLDAKPLPTTILHRASSIVEVSRLTDSEESEESDESEDEPQQTVAMVVQQSLETLRQSQELLRSPATTQWQELAQNLASETPTGIAKLVQASHSPSGKISNASSAKSRTKKRRK